MKKDMTEQEAYLQLAALCAQAEHCQQEMRDKMRRWELDETVQNRIIDRLIKERYVDKLDVVIRQGNSTKPEITEVKDLDAAEPDVITRGGFLRR